MVKSQPVRFHRARTREALIIPASEEGVVRVVYASFGVVLPPVPLRRPGTASADTILESAPVLVGGQQVIYRLRYSAEQPHHIVLEAIVRADSSSAIVQDALTGFEHDVWIPIAAVESKVASPDKLMGDRSSQWVPKGCPRSISNISYCS